ncbi:type VII secretion system-associated protein [Streptomyces sp. NPDC087901]|uniref:type VII secretion system-associated protein n=1 Tax=Streptomyces sp. NPDC087901 TaxID=3365818 RepID=UPI00380D7D38
MPIELPDPVPVPMWTETGQVEDDEHVTGIWDPGIIQPRRFTARGEDMPVPPPWALDAARQAPENWLFLPDPNWGGEGMPPTWAVLGRWRSNAHGQIVEWQDNDEYRPSPEALGWPHPADAVEAALQRTATGYGPQEDLVRALAEVEQVAVPLDGKGKPRIAITPEGLQATAIFSPLPASGALDVDVPDHQVMSVTDLLLLLPDNTERLLYLGLSSPVSVTLKVEHLIAARKEAAAQD